MTTDYEVLSTVYGLWSTKNFAFFAPSRFNKEIK